MHLRRSLGSTAWPAILVCLSNCAAPADPSQGTGTTDDPVRGGRGHHRDAEVDVGADVAGDATGDVGADVAADVPRDAGTDAGVDAGTDARVDAAGDVATDAGMDAGTDVGTDAAVDSGADAGIDAAVDAGTDAGTDAAVDSGEDAGVDAGTDAGGPVLYVATNGSDSNPGTASAPFATLQHAMAVATPGTRVLVRAGVYPGGGWIDARGTASAPIQAISVDGPRLAVLSGGFEGLRIGDAAQYLVFDGFEVRNTTDNAVHVDGDSHHIWFRNLYAHDAGVDGDALKADQCDHIFVEHCELARPGPRSDTSEGNPYQECLDFVNVDDSAVRDSFLHDGGGTLLSVKGSSRNPVIERNVIADQRAGASDPAVGLGGITDIDLLGGASFEIYNVVFRNNIVQNGAAGAVGIYDAQGAYLANNLLLDNDRVLIEFRAGGVPRGHSETVRVSNNLFVDNRGRMPVPYLLSSHGLTDFSTSYNLYWNNGASIPTSSLVNVPAEPGYLMANPGVASATGDRDARVAAMQPSPAGPAAGTGLVLTGAPFYVTDDIRQRPRDDTRDRGPYVLSTAP